MNRVAQQEPQLSGCRRLRRRRTRGSFHTNQKRPIEGGLPIGFELFNRLQHPDHGSIALLFNVRSTLSRVVIHQAALQSIEVTFVEFETVSQVPADAMRRRLFGRFVVMRIRKVRQQVEALVQTIDVVANQLLQSGVHALNNRWDMPEYSAFIFH